MILSHICSRWRKVALELPYLWNALNLTIHNQSNCVRDCAEIANIWFSRSATLPLCLSTSFAQIHSYEAIAIPEKIFGPLIFKYQNRFRVLSLKSSYQMRDSFRLGTLTSLGELQTLELHSLPLQNAPPAPKLRRVRFNSIPEPLSSIPWRQLTHVDLSRTFLSSSIFLSIISLSSNLIDGAFLLHNDYHDFNPTFPIALPKLTRLGLHNLVPTNQHLLSHFSSPCLQQFDLVVGRVTLFQRLPYTEGFSKIKTMTLTLFFWRNMPDTEIFLGLSSLVSLTLLGEGQYGTCDSFLTALVMHHNPPFLPRLEQFDMHIKPQAGFTPEVYSNAIRARRRRAEDVTRLLRASILYDDSAGGCLVARRERCLRRLLKSCIDDGLDFSIRVSNIFAHIESWSAL